MVQGAWGPWPAGILPVEMGPRGRWARFERLDGGVVYLQERSWDAHTRPDYLVVLAGDEGPIEQVRCTSVDEAFAELRRLVRSPSPAHS